MAVSLHLINSYVQYELICNVSFAFISVEERLIPLFPPVGLKTMVLSSSTIVLTWTDTSIGPSQKLLDNRYYTVRYRLATEAENDNNR